MDHYIISVRDTVSGDLVEEHRVAFDEPTVLNCILSGIIAAGLDGLTLTVRTVVSS